MAAQTTTVFRVVACLALCVSAAEAKTYVTTPSVEWEAVVPYVRANVVAELKGNEFNVYVCPEHTDRTALKPFDEALADFTRVLITESMHSDDAVEASIGSAAASFRRRIPELSADDRNAFRTIFWDTLARSPYFLPKIQARFAAARKEGKLRCWLCEKEPSYAPKAPRAGKH